MENRVLFIFRRINEAISLSPDVEAVARSILDIIIHETPAENSSRMMHTADRSKLEIKAAKGRKDKRTDIPRNLWARFFPLERALRGWQPN
jgi:hypothetical protein